MSREDPFFQHDKRLAIQRFLAEDNWFFHKKVRSDIYQEDLPGTSFRTEHTHSSLPSKEGGRENTDSLIAHPRASCQGVLGALENPVPYPQPIQLTVGEHSPVEKSPSTAPEGWLPGRMISPASLTTPVLSRGGREQCRSGKAVRVGTPGAGLHAGVEKPEPQRKESLSEPSTQLISFSITAWAGII